jgi:hypothetical protein
MPGEKNRNLYKIIRKTQLYHAGDNIHLILRKRIKYKLEF